MKTQKFCPLLGHLTTGGLYGDQKIENKRGKRKITVRPLSDSSILLFEQFIGEYDWSSVRNAVDVGDVGDVVRSFLEATNNVFDTLFSCKSMKLSI